MFDVKLAFRKVEEDSIRETQDNDFNIADTLVKEELQTFTSKVTDLKP